MPQQPPRRTRTIVVDSRRRDLSASPLPDAYSVRLSEELRAVESLELVYALYPSAGPDAYANLFVVEAEDRGSVVALDSAEVSGAIAQLPMLAPVNEYTPARHYRALTVFRVPLARLSKLTVRFADAFGRAYPFQDHLLRFEAVCWERHRDGESDLVQRLAAAPPPVPMPPSSPESSGQARGYSAEARGYSAQTRMSSAQALMSSAQARGCSFEARGHSAQARENSTPLAHRPGICPKPSRGPKPDAGVRALHNLSKNLSALAVGDSAAAGRRRI